MDSDTIADFKQFMETTISQSLAAQTRELDLKFKKIDERFDEIDQRFDEVLDAIGGEFKKVDAKLDDHEERIVTLEHKTA